MTAKNKELAKKLCAMYKKIKVRSNWESEWEDCAKYAAPEKDAVWDFNSQSKGERKHEKVYDASPIHYSEKQASALHSMLTNPSVPWFDLTSGDPELDRVPEVRKWLQELVRRMHQIYNNSNFQTEIHQIYLDLAVFGTGSLRMLEDDDLVIRFLSRPIYEYHIQENYMGEVDTIFNETKMSVRQAIQKFGIAPFSLEETQEFKKDLMKEVRVLHAIMPRKDAIFNRMDAGNKPFASYHVLLDKEVMLKESGFNEFPFAVPRWMKISGEKYGRSPTMGALSDIKMLNEIMKDTIVAAQKSTSPPLFLPDDGIFGPVDISPGAINYYRSGSRDDIFPLEMGSRPDISLNFMEELRARIKAFYFVDQLELIATRPEMTATEVVERRDDNLRFLAPLLGRQHFELLQPLIGRTIGIMTRRGMLPEDMPDQLQDRTPEVFYTSQIAKAQRSAEGQNLERFFAQIQAMVQVAPEVLDIVDGDAYVRASARANSIPEDILHNDDRVKETRDARAEQQAAEAEQMQDAQDSQNMKNIGSVAGAVQEGQA